MTPEQAQREAEMRHEAAQTMKQMCVEYMQSFAKDYVEKWTRVHGESDSIKAQGWAVMQASVALRDSVL